MKYYEKQADAEAAAERLLADPRVAFVRTALEPYNGWIVVLVPKFMDCSDLVDQAEVRDGVKRVYEGRRRCPPLPSSSHSPRHDGVPSHKAAPSRGATARVWNIASSMPGAERKSVIAACVEQGINAATASTQYGKWKKASANG